MTVRIKNGWIFSKTEDMYLFVLPFLAGWMIVIIHQLLNLRSIHVLGRDSLVMLFALLAFLDAGHVFSTVFRSYLDKNARQEKKALLYGAPVIIYLILLSLYNLFGMRTVLIFFGYFNVYHIIRQQYGWISISARRAGENNRFDYYLDKITIYAFLILPVIWIHFSLPGTEKQITLPKNEIIANACVILLTTFFCLYLARQAFKIYKGLPINISKAIQMALSFAAWGAVIFLQSPVLLFITVFMHSIPYMGIVYKTNRRSQSDHQPSSSIIHYKYSIFIFIVVAIGLGILYTKTNSFLKLFKPAHILGIPREYFICFLLLFPLMHFVIDGVIWKKKNFKVQKIMEENMASA